MNWPWGNCQDQLRLGKMIFYRTKLTSLRRGYYSMSTKFGNINWLKLCYLHFQIVYPVRFLMQCSKFKAIGPIVILEKYIIDTLHSVQNIWKHRENSVFIILHPKAYWTYYLEVQLNSYTLFKKIKFSDVSRLCNICDYQLNKAGAARAAASCQRTVTKTRLTETNKCFL